MGRGLMWWRRPPCLSLANGGGWGVSVAARGGRDDQKRGQRSNNQSRTARRELTAFIFIILLWINLHKQTCFCEQLQVLQPLDEPFRIKRLSVLVQVFYWQSVFGMRQIHTQATRRVWRRHRKHRLRTKRTALSNIRIRRLTWKVPFTLTKLFK